MALTISALIDDVARELQDNTTGSAHIRWTRPELLDYFNAGQRVLTERRPDQFVEETTLSISGWRTELPPEVHTLLDVTNNMNAGYKRITKTDAWVLDSLVSNWRGVTAAREVFHFMYDIRNPKEVLFYPPAIFGTQVRAVVQKAIHDVPSEADSPSIPERWMDAVRNYVLFRAWSKDAEFGGNANLAQAHLALFNDALGTQTKAANEMAPAV